MAKFARFEVRSTGGGGSSHTVLVNLDLVTRAEPYGSADRQLVIMHFRGDERLAVMGTFDDIAAQVEAATRGS